MLSAKRVSRRFGDLLAVDDASFVVQDGTITGFLGANGAGKTTIMRMIMGLLSVDSGELEWNGSALTPEIRRRFGYMPEERGLYPKQRILDQLAYFGRLKGQSSRTARSQSQNLLEKFGLADRTKSKLETLSLGNQQRVQIAAALMGDPLMLVLDEPFSGLDPLAVDEMLVVLEEYSAKGIPVFFSSHQLELIDRICSHVVILSEGRVVAHGAKEGLITEERQRYRLEVSGHLEWLRSSARVEVLSIKDGCAEFTVEDACDAHDVVARAIEKGGLVEFRRMIPTLSEMYRRVVR